VAERKVNKHSQNDFWTYFSSLLLHEDILGFFLTPLFRLFSLKSSLKNSACHF
jgi:hypothetical protein